MKKNLLLTPKHKNNGPRIALTILLVAIVGSVVVFGAAMYRALQPYSSPDVSHPLGQQAEYIGKRDFGGGFSDSTPKSEYYYATNLTKPELETYFKQAAHQETYHAGSSSTYEFEYSSYKTKDSGSFNLTLYSNKTVLDSDTQPLQKTTKSLIFSLEDHDYKKALQSL